MVYKLRFFGPQVLIISLIFGVLYGVVQQSYRQSANDPQIQLAEDMAQQLNGKSQPTFPSVQVDPANSLAPFLIIYNQLGQPVFSQMSLDGKTPELPLGVLAAANIKQNRLTWQPKMGVRLAVVVQKYNNGYVLSGRSLREVEKREGDLFKEVFLGYLLTVGLGLMISLVFLPKRSK